MKKTIQSLFICAILILSIFAIGCEEGQTSPDAVVTPTDKPIDTKPETDKSVVKPSDSEDPKVEEATQELKKFSSAEEISEFLKESQSSGSFGGINTFGRGMIMEESMAMDAVAVSAPMAKMAESGGSAVASDVSTTNVQVKGVDEADFVKNDNKYIYVLSQGQLVIVDSYPADDAEILSETKIKGTPRNMFVNEDRLVVFTTDNDQIPVFTQFDFMPRPRYSQITHAYVYDISDRSNPDLIKDYNLAGNYFESRMIGDYVYFIVKENVYYYSHYVDVPILRQGSNKIIEPEIYYFDNPEDNYNFNTVASFDILSDQDDINAETYMMGYSNNLYVSKNNIYITYQKNLPWTHYRMHNEERFYDIVVPLLPTESKNAIFDIKDDKQYSSYQKWSKIQEVLEEMYNGMHESKKKSLIKEIDFSIEEYEAKLEAERRKTVIHKINIDEGDIEYDTRGEVSGYLLNQFSMDESGEYFRVATTTYIYRGSSTMYNNVYVMDSDLDVVGSIEDIAPDERIYSTRFVGDRLYMVTFKNIDPFFVIDLSDPEDPFILGELKIPGFSDYLHPYDENHIIGIGKETDSNGWGGTSVAGVKLALFDVTDVQNPKQIDKYEIGEKGTDSEALRDHKAFLFDKEKNILVLPVREVKGRTYDERRHYYRNDVWQGAYVFSLTPEDGFDLKGTISHYEGDEEERWYWNSPAAVRRSLYMDDVLYTISAKMIKMNDIDDIDVEINEVDLPYEEDDYWRYRWY